MFKGKLHMRSNGIIIADEINCGRQKELDLAKGLAIIFMVWVHVMEECGKPAEDLATIVVDWILGSLFAAPVFMVCLGIGICYSRKNSPASLARRGVSLLLIGLVLNLVRFAIPDYIYGILDNEDYSEYLLYDLINVDILQFAGLAFLFLALVKKLKLPNIAVLIIGLLCSALGTILRGMSVGNDVADLFLGFIYGTNMESYFPFLNWIIFPVAGYLGGQFLRRCADKNRLYKIVTAICFPIGMAYIVVCTTMDVGYCAGGYGYDTYYYLSILGAFFTVVFVFGWIGVNYYFVKLGEVVHFEFKMISRLSRNINSIYCIHWSILGYFLIFQQYVLDIKHLSFLWLTVVAAIFLVSSDGLAVLYHKIKNSTSII